MAGPSLVARSAMVGGLTAVAKYVSLHTTDPGTTGANEVNGPSYARKSITWAEPANGAVSSRNVPVFDVPAGAYAFFGLWTEQRGGEFLDGGPLERQEVYSGPGTYTLSSVVITQPDR